MNDNRKFQERSKISGAAKRTLLGAWLYTETSFFAWILLGPLAFFIAEEFKLSSREITLLVSLPILVGTLCHLPVGLLSDRFGFRKVGLILHILTIVVLVGLVVTPVGGSRAILYVLAAALGLAGVSFAVSMPLVSRVFPIEHQGKALGLTAFGGVGAMLSAFVAPLLAQSYGWRIAAMLGATQFAVSLAVFAWAVQEAEVQPAPPRWTDYLYVLRYADTFWFCLFYVVTFGGMVSLVSLLASYFHDRFQLSPSTAGLLTTICILTGTLFRPLGGWLADHKGGIRTLQWAFGTVLACTLWLSLVATSSTLSFTVFNLLLIMAAFGAGNGAIFQMLPVRFRHHMGVITGLVGAAGGMGGFLFVMLHGWLQNLWSFFQPLFLLYAAFSLLALVGLASVKRRWRTTWGAPQTTTARV